MPKRKRDSYENNGDSVSKRKKHVYEAYTQSKKLLNRAFKTAKGFERQKLGKRLKVATASRNAVDMARLRREIEVLGKLELAQVTEAQLNRFLLKVKVFAESEYLSEEVKRVPPKPEASEEMATALHNVTSGMCNTKQVKEAMEVVMRTMCTALGVPSPTKKSKGETMEQIGGQSTIPGVNGSSEIAELDEFLGVASSREDGDEESDSFRGFDSEEDDQDKLDIQDNEDIEIGSIDEEELSRFEALLGGSSDEDSFDLEEYTRTKLLNHTPNTTTTRQTLSISPALSEASDLTSESDSNASAIPNLSKKPNKNPSKANPTTKKALPPSRSSDSTFLPTLMGGYWSGSEESASSLSDTENLKTATSTRKNRPGQMARRAIWEKKYGTGAKHIKSGMGSVAEKGGYGKEKDDGWDARRGARDSGGRGGRDGHRRGRGGVGALAGARQTYSRQGDRATGENSTPVMSKLRGQGRKDDVGVLHPSWQAAKKAKEMKKTAKFEGKKVTFD